MHIALPHPILAILPTFGSSPDAEGSWLLLALYFVLAIGVSFCCSVWEAVLLSVTRPYIASLSERHPNQGKTLERLKTNLGPPLTSILTLNTVAHTVGSMGVASQVKALGGGIWEAIAGGLMTLAILIASEIIPKNLGARHWRTWAPQVGVCLVWLSWFMTPVVKIIERFSKNILHEETFSRDELRVMAEAGRREGKLAEGESQILNNLLKLRDTGIADVMTPRTVVFSVTDSMTVAEFLELHTEAPFSRIPIHDGKVDHAGHFVLRDDVLLAAALDQYDKPLQDLRRDLGSVEMTENVTRTFERMVTEREHILVVRDEFGGMAGVVTMEDLVETLLGWEIMDEADTQEDMRHLARALWKKRAEKMGIAAQPSEAG